VDLIDEVDEAQNTEDLRRSLSRTQLQLKRARAKVDDLVAATIEASKDATLALGPIRPTAPPRLKPAAKGLSEEVALPDTGDWQFSKVTTSYNSDVARRRVMQFAQKSIALAERVRQTAFVRDAVCVFGGDMIEGLFNFPSQPFEIDAPLFEQYVRVSRLIVEYVQLYLANFEHVTVVPEWGNHGRIGSKRDAVPRSDNVDRMCFELAKQLLENEPRLTWQDCPEDVQRLEVGNYRALVMHGDEVGRNGFASPTTLVQHMNRWKSGAYRVDGEPWRFRDVYIHHFHTHNEWALADGEGSLFQTGSTESDNRYAGIGMASTALPTQRLHFVDPEAGRVSSQYKVWLD
jgi:hypothetical protein